MRLFDFLGKKISKNTNKINAESYPIETIKEFNSGRVSVTTTSKRWGEGFQLACKSRELIPYAQKYLEYLDNLSDDIEKRLCKYLLDIIRTLRAF